MFYKKKYLQGLLTSSFVSFKIIMMVTQHSRKPSSWFGVFGIIVVILCLMIASVVRGSNIKISTVHSLNQGKQKASSSSQRVVASRDPYKLLPTSQYIVQSRSESASGISGVLQLKNGTGGPYGNDISQLAFTITYKTDSIVHVKITDKQQERWQADKYVLSEQVRNVKTSKSEANKYQVTVAQTGEPFYFTIRRSSGPIAPVFDTKNRPFIFSDQYISIGTDLAPDYFGGEPNIYGFGERIDSLRLNITDNEFVMWNNE